MKKTKQKACSHQMLKEKQWQQPWFLLYLATQSHSWLSPLNPCWCLHHVLAVVKLLITFSILMYIRCVMLCLFSTLSHRAGALQTSIIIIIICCAVHLQKMMPCALLHWVQTFCDQQIHWIFALSHNAVWQYFPLCLTCLSYFLCRLRHYQSCALYFGTP